MCGIVGLTCLPGKIVNPARAVRKSLEKLEYRGYDSVGIAVIFNGKIIIKKGKGKIHEVHLKLNFDGTPGSTVIGHTRWATHGAPSDVNAHPHSDCLGAIAVVHNGIIKNFDELRRELIMKGHVFHSDTDTEVVSHLVEDYIRKGLKPYDAFKEAIKKIKGSYAIALIMTYEPNKIFFAKKDSPLIIGLGEGFNFLASDIPAFLEYTRKIIVLRDNEVGYITPTNIIIEDMVTGEKVNVRTRVRTVNWTPEMAAKAGYPHFMLKEIHEQPRALNETLLGLGMEVDKAAELILKADRVFIAAAGTSYHAGLVFEYYLAKIPGIMSHAFISSEYSKYSKIANSNDLLVAISQSGETIDTLMALRLFKENGAKVISISNVIDSAIPRESDLTVYTRAGPEIGVAATKTFTTQVLVELVLALKVAELKGDLLPSEYSEEIAKLSKIPKTVEEIILKNEALTLQLADTLSYKNNIYYLGRGLGVPIAKEGALKLKEIAYIHAEAYPAGESKHGPIALVEKGFPVLFVVLDDENKESIVGNIMEMKARDAYTIGLLTYGNDEIAEKLDFAFTLPQQEYLVAPITYMPVLQLIAYYTAVKRGYDPDKPRNLAKTVTVE